MSFQDIEIRREYRSLKDSVVREFFMPLMHESVLYQRAVGFFSSTALACYSLGLSQLIKNDGKIELVASPNLSDDDLKAIQEGYELRDDVIERSLINSLTAPVTRFEQDRLNLLATLIADEKLEIKIAFVDTKSAIGIYHEKLGLLHDGKGNIVSFTGSMNESENGFSGNYETIDVFCSWKDPERVADKVQAFQRIWNNQEENVVVQRFPNIEKAILEQYRRPDEVNEHVDEEEYQFEFHIEDYRLENMKYRIQMPEDILYPYQKEAISKWKEMGYRGIFDMCTGSGKTYTAIGAIRQLFDDNGGRLAVIIAAPYQHLVEQWVDDLEKFNIDPIIGYGNPKYKDYRRRLKNAVFDYNLHARDFLCFICTNSSFAIPEVQEILMNLQEKTLLIVDEAHNFGSKSLLKTLNRDYTYRLALSATLDRHGDETGTGKLYQFFGRKCITYDLEQAIQDKRLTEYYYRPAVVILTPDELERYEAISREVGKYIHFDRNGKAVLSEKAKQLLIKRARIIAGAVGKIECLKELIKPYVKEHNILVYCGATTLLNEDLEDTDFSEDIRQIDYITRILGEELQMKVAQFTSAEDMALRAKLIEEFKTGTDLQGLIAIKCLDEGVNIPSIRTAFILASTTNPKEYIQRRGRVLRTAPGKEYAEIYDMIILPRPLDVVKNLMLDETRYDRTLVKNELNRMQEFKKLSLNPYDSNPIMDAIREAYDLYDTDIVFEDMQAEFQEGRGKCYDR